MSMEIKKVTDPAFRKYGRIIEDVDFTELLAKLEEVSPCPDDVVYVPSDAALEALPVYEELTTKVYGELPIEIGYCNGHNKKLNALEYHRDSEVNVMANDAVLILGQRADITDDMTYDTSLCEAFLIPKGMGVEVFATALHYAPCHVTEEGFRVIVVLPRGTNTELKAKHNRGKEDEHLTAVNKWLLGHPEGVGAEDPKGLIGENLQID